MLPFPWRTQEQSVTARGSGRIVCWKWVEQAYEDYFILRQFSKRKWTKENCAGVNNLHNALYAINTHETFILFFNHWKTSLLWKWPSLWRKLCKGIFCLEKDRVWKFRFLKQMNNGMISYITKLCLLLKSPAFILLASVFLMMTSYCQKRWFFFIHLVFYWAPTRLVHRGKMLKRWRMHGLL